MTQLVPMAANDYIRFHHGSGSDRAFYEGINHTYAFIMKTGRASHMAITKITRDALNTASSTTPMQLRSPSTVVSRLVSGTPATVTTSWRHLVALR